MGNKNNEVKTQQSCHSIKDTLPLKDKWIAITGFPNVGKSLLFNRLSGSSVSVSNYPGTTVTVDRGKLKTENRRSGYALLRHFKKC